MTSPNVAGGIDVILPLRKKVHQPMDIYDLLAKLPVQRFRNAPPLVTVLRLSGVIGGGTGPLRRGLSLSNLAPSIERAFAPSRLSAVALAINSPGGSPVQSALIAGRIRAMADEKKVPVFAFAEDAVASGGYWLACAADEIFADASSIVGSIGVVSGGFGFTELIRRIGVERRLHTSGEHKGMLDPFSREDPEDVGRLKSIQDDIYQAFIAHVRERRGARLKASNEILFSGAFWTGQRALELGLIDGLGDLRGIMRERFGEKVCLKVVDARRTWLRSPGVTAGPWAEAAISAVEDRLWWGRLGL
ncbi:MAG: S49 family peptidase [Rhodospirillales bacterium]